MQTIILQKCYAVTKFIRFTYSYCTSITSEVELLFSWQMTQMSSFNVCACARCDASVKTRVKIDRHKCHIHRPCLTNELFLCEISMMPSFCTFFYRFRTQSVLFPQYCCSGHNSLFGVFLSCPVYWTFSNSTNI